MILGILFAASVSTVHAAPDNEEPRVVYARETIIDFEALDIEGQLIGPDGTLVLDRRVASFNPLITLREDFNDLMSQSVDEVK